ncbi:Peptidoglycan/LPS O-acetylase OafA/YrhL, contains acyltransferase and SGNH-hydrolase domains [Pseudobutyrivibrio sp. UC1225]|uniref:acyltransferase family protein n=1 Tax=Pseudobutyrivibrio sp. UC1225 TaxID=1798185 RepID=UPI0008F0FB30|nr:acyltransferase [Pseudobutyrivibrio sp. UC1225]SFO26792.1 Peptidoglycan/LPS O-acetylase OafA/YrhL, contains acyltransferase and SGNH-hydrolase domains [Pseudobutyrivibrio sp. UC1225]
MKKTNIKWKNYLNHRNEIFGISALAIMLYHINKYVGFNYLGPIGHAITRVFALGNAGVDVFLFLSALGLTFSNMGNGIMNFYVRRARRILPVYFLISIPYFIVYDFVIYKQSLWLYFLDVFTISFWFKNELYPFWYMSFIVVAYLLFPLLIKMDKYTKHISTIIILFAALAVAPYMHSSNDNILIFFEIAISRIPAFMLGILCGSIEKEKEFSVWEIIIITSVVVISLVAIASNFIIAATYRYVVAALGLASSFLLAVILSKMKNVYITNVLKFYGEMSLEIYLVHVGLFQILKFYNVWSSMPAIIWYVVIIGVSTVISMFIHKRLQKCFSSTKTLFSA